MPHEKTNTYEIIDKKSVYLGLHVKCYVQKNRQNNISNYFI